MAKKKAAARRQQPKRKAAKPTRERKSSPGRASRAPSAKAAAVRKKRQQPEQPRLDGVEDDPPIAQLGKVCKSIAETREAINELKGEEAGYEQTALGLMRRNDRTTYHAHGVTLVRVPGEEKLQVKTTKGGAATATSPAIETPAAERGVRSEEVEAQGGDDGEGDEVGDLD